MSLGGLALATGLVVDDSIVVLESIAKARERGLGIVQAAIVGTREVSMAVVASTLTTIAVFLPLVFVEGIAGQLFRDQALTVALAIAISLVVSMTLIPMLSSIRGRAPLAFKEEAPHPRWEPTSKLQKPVAATGRGIGWAIRNGAFAFFWLVRAPVARAGCRHRPGDAQASAAVAMGIYDRARSAVPAHAAECARASAQGASPSPRSRSSPRSPVVPLLGADLIPQLAQDRFEMTVKLPPGTPLRDTDKVVQALQGEHGKDENLTALYGVSGTGTRLDASPTESGENIAKLTAVMKNGGSEKIEAEADREAAREHGRPQRHAARLQPPGTLQPVHAAGNRTAGSGPAADRSRRPQARDDAARQPALRRRDLDGGAGLPGNPDPLRPGSRRFARPDHAPDRRCRGQEGARRSRHALLLPRPQDRRAGACAGDGSRVGRRHPQSHRQSEQQHAGAPVVGGRRRRGHGPERNPPRRPGARGDRLGEPARHRPRRGRAGSAADGARHAARRGRGHAHRRAGRGTRSFGEVADVRVRPRGVPRVPGDGFAVRIAAASLRHPLHDPARPRRRGARAVADRTRRSRWWCSSA